MSWGLPKIGEDMIAMSFTEPTITVTIDNTTGEIVVGAWHYRTATRVGEAQMSLGSLTATLKNFEAAFETEIIFPAS